MVKDDPIVIQKIYKGSDRKIQSFEDVDGKTMSYEDVKEEINKGQIFQIISYEGDPAVLQVDRNGVISTNKDDTELNNLTGNTNLKVDIVDS